MWNSSPHFLPQQGPTQPCNHRECATSDHTSVSSTTTGLMSQGHGYTQPRPHHQSNIPPNNNNNTDTDTTSYNIQSPNNNYTTHFYPSSHIHNQPLNTISQNPYLSSPPAPLLPPHPPSLTSILLNSSPQSFALATQHPFLRFAGLGTLPKPRLSQWLSQDRLYAQAYIGFIGSLIARVDLPYMNIRDKSSSLRWRLVNCLTSALKNIHTELAFFTDTATKYNLDLDAPTRVDGFFTAEPATKQYIDLFRAFWTDPSMSLLEGMVVLWATETVYLSAWRYASSFINSPEGWKETNTTKSDEVGSQTNSQARSPPGNGNGTSHSSDLDRGALRDAFIPNWTSSEFEAFVAEIAELTDLLAEREDAVNRRLDVYKAVWRHILDVERRFWPDVEGIS